MGKKKEPRLVQHREIYQRMNFLYQAATLMTTITSIKKPKQQQPSTYSSNSLTQSSSVQQEQVPSTKSKTRITTTPSNSNTNNLASLGRFYVNTMKTIGKKQVLRIDPSIKRTLCKRCESILLPGVTSRVRIKSRPEPCYQVLCTECNSSKNYPTRKGYQLFSEKPENIFRSNELSSPK